MKKKLYYKDKQPIGLDISQTGIKVMAVDPKRWLVQGYGSIDLDPAKVHNALNDNKQEDSYITDNLRQLMSRNTVGNLPSNHVIIGVPTSQTFSRTFSIPANQEKTLDEAVEIEAEQYIPLPREVLYLDYEITERDKYTIQVAMSAIPKTIVDAVVKAAWAADLRPVAVEPSINAAARLLEMTEEGHLTTLIVDIGQAATDIAVLLRGTIRVTGGVGVGGNTFTLNIANKLKVPLNNAHQLKVLSGLSASPRQAKIAKALTPSLEKITTEIRKVMRYYSERLGESDAIDQIIIVGAGSNMPGIGEYYTNELVMPVRVASPWQKLDFGRLPQPNKQFRPRYITVAGLASIQGPEVLS